MEAGVNKDLKNNDEHTALMRACGKGRTDIVRLLVGCRARLGLMDKDDNTALLHASLNNHIEIAPLLNQELANMDVRA